MSKSIVLAVLTVLLPSLASVLGLGAFAADSTDSPFIVHGTITDDTGKPLPGVEINAHCGLGTLFLAGTTKTDEHGGYRLAFEPGMAVADTRLGVGTQVATITPRLSGWCEVQLGRGGNLLMTDDRDELEADMAKGYAGVVAAGEAYELNFTMTAAATVRGRLVNEFGRPIKGVAIDITGEELPPSSSILESATTDDDGRFVFETVPVWLGKPSNTLTWRFTMSPFGVRHELHSSSFEVSARIVSEHRLSLESAGGNGQVCLSFVRETMQN